MRTLTKALVVTAGILAGAALFWIGHATVHTGSADIAITESYFAGLRAGEAQGRQEGRAIQEGAELPSNSRQPVKDAFDAGYAAGANDAFAGYDGGWTFSVPYVVTVEEGTGQIVYRIDTRTPVEAHVNYYLCDDGHGICQERRP